MKQKIFNVLFIIIVCTMLIFPNQSLAVTISEGTTIKSVEGRPADEYEQYYTMQSEDDEYDVITTQPEHRATGRDYTIDSYNIIMNVNENNTFDITESIVAYFNVSKHGIYRKFPLKNSIIRTDGTKSQNRAQITNISVNEKYTTENDRYYKTLRIGDPNTTIRGEHLYKIKYNYNIGKDPLKNADELYFNLVGNEWDTTIENLSFTINMPKTFDESLLGFSSGYEGSTNSSNVEYTVNGNTITGNIKSPLLAGQGLTVRLTLPEGYFVGAGVKIDTFSMYVIGVCVIFVLIAYIAWTKYGKDDEVIETVEFYPPEGYNSAEAGFLYKGSAETEGIISLLIYLANQGYLKIEEIEDRGLFTKSKSFKITKLKEYTGNNEYERLFFEGLFKSSGQASMDMRVARDILEEAKKHGEKISFQEALEMSTDTCEDKDSVTESDLYNNFYKTLNKIKLKMNSKENKSKIFEKSASNKIKEIILMIVVIAILITIKPMVDYGMPEIILFAVLFPRSRFYNVGRKSFRTNKNT